MTRAQIRVKLDDLKAAMQIDGWRDTFSQWEKNFVDDNWEGFKKGWTFSEKQETTIKKLWRKI